MKRFSDDAAIAAADRVYAALLDEARRHEAAHGNDGTDPVGRILHLVLMTRIAKLAEAGLANLDDPRIAAITSALAELEGDARGRLETGALFS